MAHSFLNRQLAKRMESARQSAFDRLFAMTCDLSPAGPISAAVQHLGQRLALRDLADACAVTSYGFGAILALCLSHLKRGDHVLVSTDCFGSYSGAFQAYMRSYGVELTYVAPSDLAQWQQGVRSTTQMALIAMPDAVAGSTMAQQQARLIAQLSTVLDQSGFDGQHIQLVVDLSLHKSQCYTPLTCGADFVLYTNARFLAPALRVVAGVICGRALPMVAVTQCMMKARVCISQFNAESFSQSLDGCLDEMVLDHRLDGGSKGGTATLGQVLKLPLSQNRTPQKPLVHS